jgi:hypothetical protein
MPLDEVVNALLRKPILASALVEAIEQGRLSVGEVEPAAREIPWAPSTWPNRNIPFADESR